MLATVLALLPKIGPVVAALPEFLALIDTIKDTMNEKDQETLQNAYELAMDGSDKAHAELQALVASKTA